MSIPKGYNRVSRRTPCPICGRPDYCLIHREGQYAGCARTRIGCDRDKDGGEIMVALTNPTWRFTLNSSHAISTASLAPAKPRTIIDPAAIHHQCVRAREMLVVCDMSGEYSPFPLLANELGLSEESLVDFGIGWHAGEGAWSWPMYDCAGKIVGIRLRSDDGVRKYAVTGSRHGCFLARGEIPHSKVVHIVEGPTESAALADWGFENILGLPSCNVLSRWLLDYIHAKEVIFFANCDRPKKRPDGSEFFPGQDAAERLAEAMTAERIVVKIVYPCGGHKDWRDWSNAGATRARVDAAIRNAPYWKHQG